MHRLLFRAALACAVAALLVVDGSSVSGQDAKTIEKVTAALPAEAPAKPKAKRKLLIFSKTAGFRHGSIAVGAKAIAMMGDKTGAFTALHTEDESIFEPSKLNEFDAVWMMNTTGACLRPKIDDKAAAMKREEELKASLEEFVKNGKGLGGCHSATDTYQNWKAYNQMMGGAFVSHPWSTKVPVKNLEPKHPLNAAFDGKDFEINDEIYMFRDDTALPTERKILLALDGDKMDLTKQKRKNGQYPISWVSTFGKGRTFYCSLGHNNHIYHDPAVLKHYLAGIQYMLGDLDVDAAPSAKAEEKKD